MKDLKNMKKDLMMVKKFRSINFNTFMNFMVNPFVSDIRATKGFRLGGLAPISAVLSAAKSRFIGAAICGWLVFLVDKLVVGGLDDWEVKIADFVPSTAKASRLDHITPRRATRHVGFVGERCEKGC